MSVRKGAAVNEIVLAALLREWLDDLVNAIDGLEALPPLKDKRQTVIIEDLPELANLWSVRGSISELIERLEGNKS